jgi:hypothetical protein
MRAPSLAILFLFATAACGPMANGGDPPRLAATAAVDTNPPVMTDSMVVAGVDTVYLTDSLASPAAADAPRVDPEPEPRPGAIGCTRVDPPPSAAETPTRGYRRLPARFSCVIREGSAAMEARVELDPVQGYAFRVRMPRPSDPARWTEVLDTAAESEPYHDGYPVVEAVDFDQDGWGELKLMEWWGATGNLKFHVWRFDPRHARFVPDSVLSETISPHPLPGKPACVRGHSHGGGATSSTWTICRERGRWVETDSERQHSPEGKPYFLRVRQERRNGTMMIVHTDTLTPDEAWHQ